MSDTTLLSALLQSMQALNGISQTALFLAGNTTSPAAADSVVLSTQAGWVANIQVTSVGTGNLGYLYNCQTVAAIAPSNALMPILNSLGTQKGGFNFNQGLVAIPGSGQAVSVTYSLTPPKVQS